MSLSLNYLEFRRTFILFVCFILCSTQRNNDIPLFSFSNLLQEQLEIAGKPNHVLIQYNSLKNLPYGSKCNIELEEKNVKFDLATFPAVLQKFGPPGNEFNNLNLTIALENAIQMSQGYALEIVNSTEGGLCNMTSFLFCDKEVGGCRCGKPFNFGLPEYSFVLQDNVTETLSSSSNTSVLYDGRVVTKIVTKSVELEKECRMDKGSGCTPKDLVHAFFVQTNVTLTEEGTVEVKKTYNNFTQELFPKCRTNSHCVTLMDKLPCTGPNQIAESKKYQASLHVLSNIKGFSCFCQDESSN